jgi:hypothetical protein
MCRPQTLRLAEDGLVITDAPHMAHKGPHGIMILERLDPVRRRPAMYIGGEELHPSARCNSSQMSRHS